VRQLPGALVAMACALRAGAGIAAALRQLVEHGEAPLAQEFGLLLREQRMGVSFDAALARLARRASFESMALVAAALRVAAHTGGNLAETLEGIAQTVSARLQLQDRVRALCAQGRMQAWIVGALPPVLMGVLGRLQPEAMAALWHTLYGWAALALIVVLEGTGIWLIRRIVAIDV
ncbi:type II secretion system F family protein, partial [Bordetella bronchiseptica]